MSLAVADNIESQEFADKLVAADPVRWATVNKIKVIGGEFTTKDHEYQITPMRSTALRRCYMKATKGGWTEMEVLRTLHGMIYNHYPAGVLHAFPTNDTVSDFSKGRFKPLIDRNPCIRQFVRSTDSTSVKQVNDAFLYLRGARLSEVMDSATKESTKLKDIIVDRFVADECDHMSEMVFEKMRGRLMASRVQEEVYVSNPVLPDCGIHALFQKSDQRQWFRHCGSCNTWSCAELEFPNCVKIRPNGDSYIGCKKCGKKLEISPGEWVPAYPKNSDYMEGYHLSHLTSSFIKPGAVLDAFEDPPEGNLSDVYRLRLGLPHVAVDERLTESQVLNSCGMNLMRSNFGGPAAMGVDVGNTLHVVIAHRKSRAEIEIIKLTRVTEWDDLHELIRRFGVKAAVVDLKPEGHSAKKFRSEAKCQVYLCDYSDTQKTTAQWNQETGVVTVNKTEICDKSHRLVADENKLELPRRCSEVEVYAKQMTNIAKVLEEDKRTGNRIYRYRKLGSRDEHYRHATNYLLLACGKVGVTETVESVKRNCQQVSTYYV